MAHHGNLKMLRPRLVVVLSPKSPCPHLLKAMRADKDYRDSVVSYGKVTRVKLAAFDRFWRAYAAKH